MKYIILIVLSIILGTLYYKDHHVSKYKVPNEAITLNSSEIINLLKTEPEQTRTSDDTFEKGNYIITPVKDYKITARILREETYEHSEFGDLIPIDLALGWNKMSDLNAIKKEGIDITQSGRFYFWKTPNFNQFSRHDIEHNSANNHIAPANDDIKNYILKNFKAGQVVYMEGNLINLKLKSNGRYLTTSTSRDDTGAGACEVIWVKKVKILDVD
jgi:hypothetical protein